MGKLRKKDIPDLSAFAHAGAKIAVRATPGAAQARINLDGQTVRISVTELPEAGQANAAIRKLLAKSLGVAPSELCLERGESSRDKLFVLR